MHPFMSDTCTHSWVTHALIDGMTHSWVTHDWWNDSFMSDTCTHSHSCMNPSCHIYGCVMSHVQIRHVTHINASCHMNPSCHTYECTMWHLWMCHVTCMNVGHVTHMNESCHSEFGKERMKLVRQMSHVTWVMSHESCYTCEWGMCHVWMSYSTAKFARSRWSSSDKWVMSRVTWVMEHVWMGHVTRMNESCRSECGKERMELERQMSHVTCHTSHGTCVTRVTWVMEHVEWVTSCTREWAQATKKSCHIRHVTRMKDSCHTYEGVMSHVWMSHVTANLVRSEWSSNDEWAPALFWVLQKVRFFYRSLIIPKET